MAPEAAPPAPHQAETQQYSDEDENQTEPGEEAEDLGEQTQGPKEPNTSPPMDLCAATRPAASVPPATSERAPWPAAERSGPRPWPRRSSTTRMKTTMATTKRSERQEPQARR